MADDMSTFLRYEIKYMLDDRQYAAFRRAIEPHTRADAYGKYSVCNLYYDTDTFEIIRRSMEKPVYKEKLRVRSYGIPDEQDKVFFELKKKYQKEVSKRRVSMSLRALRDHLETGAVPDVSPQVMGEIDYFLSLYHPQPRIFIAYDRVALSGKEDRSLRITFDRNIRFRCDDLDLSLGDHGRRILADSRHLAEIKVHGAMPLWLSGALDGQQIYPTSFSKYGYCYEHFILPGGGAVNAAMAGRKVA